MENELKTGYCCNVHGGTTLNEVKANLEKFACEVKRQVSPDDAMPIGLWLSQSAMEGLGNASQNQIDATNAFGDWLAARGLEPFTFNGFPQGDFHQEVVKHEVYLPTWADRSRLEYTQKLAVVQTMLLARSTSASKFQTISTLPMGWPPVPKEKLFSEGIEFLNQCSANLRTLARFLATVEKDTGSRVMVCIEPEPGCIFDTCHDIVRFFEERLLNATPAENEMVLRHIGVCHDVCHSAVMFEDQATAVLAYKNAGIQIGKVQVSSAIKVHFGGDEALNRLKREQLAQFSEPRYLHQASVQCLNGSNQFYEDLSIAFADATATSGEWRVHFHVPIFAERLGVIESTQSDIGFFLDAIQQHDVQVEHFEIETYAWNVLPESYRGLSRNLASGIAEELRWFDETKSRCKTKKA
jgi:hypothetical protein